MSAIRVSPPSTGSAHDGKTVGVDEVEYKYKQVRKMISCTLEWTLTQRMTKPVPIASYILAIASGNLSFRAFDVPPGVNWTSGVWTEPEMMDRSYWEFSADTTK
jgi:leukotriene-A4 hydrolase